MPSHALACPRDAHARTHARIASHRIASRASPQAAAGCKWEESWLVRGRASKLSRAQWWRLLREFECCGGGLTCTDFDFLFSESSLAATDGRSAEDAILESVARGSVGEDVMMEAMEATEAREAPWRLPWHTSGSG
tara:strand:- start:1120 stop:1527 length:408 start_codon:yes stop_codon:yes gene_type:complete